jgi:hypothetical protein
MALTALPAQPAADCWAVLDAAVTRPDVPSDVRVALLGAIAYREVLTAELGKLGNGLAVLAAEREGCDW